MKSYLPLLSFVLFTSCTTAYQSGQTPDDVYFSPTRPREEYVRYDEEREGKRQYRREAEEREERELRMRVRNRRWSTLDDVDYRYSYRPYYSNSPWTSYLYWNYAYNPNCCCAPVVTNPRSPVYSQPRRFNLNTFLHNNPPATDPKTGQPVNASRSASSSSASDNYRGSNRDAGSFLRGMMGSGGSSSGSAAPAARSSSGSSSSSSGSSGSSSGSSRASTRKD